MNVQTIFIVARQAGTAAAFAPVIRRLAQLNKAKVVVAGIGLAQKFFLEQKIESREISSFSDVEGDWGQVLGSAVLLTGTSSEADEDARFWKWARKKNIPSIAYLDQWVNFEYRFPRVGDLYVESELPRQLAVIDGRDAALAHSLASLGVEIDVTGSPALEDLANQVAPLRLLRLKSTRAPDLRAIFATEPLAVGSEEDYRKANGFTDLDSLRVATGALAKWMQVSGEPWKLSVKLHPRDSVDRVSAAVSELAQTTAIPIEISSENRIDAFVSADLVLGMRSFFLYESAFLGIPTVSFQPNRKTLCPLTDDRLDLNVVVDEADGLGAIRSALSKRDIESVLLVPATVSPTGAIVDLVLRALSR